MLVKIILSKQDETWVVVREAHSNPRSVNLGVSQGSILGPLLFIIYIRYIVKVLTEGRLIMYADDTTLY